MDQRRLILFLVLSFSILMLWEGWQKQHQPVPAPTANVPQATSSADGAVPTPSSSAAAVPPTADARSVVSDAPRVTVRTDMLVAEVSAEGGSIVHLELTKHKSRDDVTHNFVLFDDGAEHIYTAQSGLIGDGLPTHRTTFALPAGEQVLKDGQDTLTVRLEAPEQNGVKVAKLLTFHRGSYVVDVAWEINNAGSANIAPHAYYQFTRDGKPSEPAQRFGVNAFTGPAFYTEAEKYQKVKFDEIENGKAKFAKKASDGWMALVQHYFVGAWLPQGNVEREFFARKVGNDLYSSGVILPIETIAPGQSGKVSAELYAGPQEQKNLSSITKGLDLVVDYGWLTVIAAPLFWVLSWVHSVVGNWGWSIILVTVAIKALFFPLSAASYKSMAKMRVLGPRMQRLKELYGDDKVKLQQEMMEMYKREKINPLGGCLPILVQIPVFISLYWVLLGSVEMRHAPWLGWIQDLSAQDPYYILPVLMGISMFVQTKLNPTPPDPIQAKVMLIMPLVFSVMFLWFPSGLVLYWVVNNVLSIAQQWKITRMIEGGKTGAKPA
ncbi:membrane protein insertase YidC [Azoarcus sp. KH32C]|uniref:membrane protein insertase YidC n=1 Tax=Azoarcus sp. KH32C TaxID=748247 RepID=UPI0002385C59|nr:membrane protein insertase YidC [Azoarcus sp. KH32C]BAL26881.1 preprotein translocase subunit [Azoarcus sp. KH32C]